MKQHAISHIVTGLILSLFIISFSVIFTLNFRPLYYVDIHLLHIDQSSGLSIEEIKTNYNALIDYNSLFSHKPLSFPTLSMSESGRIHFEEVKQIFDLFGYLLFVSLIGSAIGICRLYHASSKLFLKIAGLISLILPVMLGILIAFNWEYVFIKFHELVFNNDYWIFDASTDPVITILPDSFFMHCAIMILSIIILLSSVSLALSREKACQ